MPEFTEHGAPLTRLKALADDARYAAVRVLAGGARPAEDLAGVLDAPLTEVLAQLDVLWQAGLVWFDEQDGPRVYGLKSAPLYSLGGDVLSDLFGDELRGPFAKPE